MTNVNEAASGTKTPLAADLQQGLETISLDQVVTFHLYQRVILPLDGYAFWVRKTAFGSSSAYNAAMFNDTAAFNDLEPAPPPLSFQAKGSLHYITNTQQLEESSSSQNRVVFTAEEPVQNLNAINSQFMYIASFDDSELGDVAPANGSPIRFSFSYRNSHYVQAGLWHYTGNAVFQSMDSQIIDDPNTLLNQQLIVSNSLPAWLALTGYDPPWHVPVPMPAVSFYPSFLVPDNLSPPYISVHIEPTQTEGWQALPRLMSLTEQYQLARDRVQLTLYGCSNDVAQSVLYAILQYSYDTEAFGVLNIPAVRDEKETQVELHTLAQKKRITFDVSYNQTDIRNIARQLITSCIPTVSAADL